MKKLVAVAFFALFGLFGVAVAPASEFEELRWGGEGDAALALGDYSAAENLYRRYLNSAVIRGDSPSVRSAYLRLINLALVRGDESAAEEALNGYREMLENPDDASAKALDADLMLLRGDFADAEKALRELSAVADLPDYLYDQVLFSLGTTLLEEEKFHDAAEVFKLAASRNGGSEAAFLHVYALQQSGDMIGSREALGELADGVELSGDRRNALKVLEICQAIGEKRFAEALALFEKLPSPDAPDRRRCAAATTLAEHFRDARDGADDAEALLNDAFLCAPTPELRKYLLGSLIELFSERGQNVEAAAAMEKFISLYPDGDDRFENLIQLAHLLNRAFSTRAGAISAYRGLIEDPAAPPEVKLRAAREGAAACEQADDLPGAEAMYEFLIANSTSDASRAEALLLAANCRYNHRDFAGSAEYAELAAGVNSEWRFPALFALMNARGELGDYAAALSSARALKNNGVGEWPRKGAFAEAELLENSGDIPAAVNAYADFSSLWSFSEEAPAALYLAGKLSFDRGDYERAAEYFKLLADRYAHYSGTPHGLYLAAYAEYLLKNFPAMDQAVEKLEYGYRESPYTVGALFWKLDCLKVEKRHDEALRLLDRMLEEYGDSSSALAARIKFEKGEVLASLERTDEALALYGEATLPEVSPELAAKSRIASGELALRRGDYSGAREFFQSALELAPESRLRAVAVGKLAEAVSADGLFNNNDAELAEAKALYEELLETLPETDPLYIPSQHRLGVVRRELGDTEGAAACFEKLVSAALTEKRLSGDDGGWLYTGVKNYAEAALKNGSAAMLDRALKLTAAADGEYDQELLLPIKQRLIGAFAAAEGKTQNGD